MKEQSVWQLDREFVVTRNKKTKEIEEQGKALLKERRAGRQAAAKEGKESKSFHRE